MEKLFNWTIGSFFRTIGRLIAYFAIGAFIAYIFSNSNIKLPRITNLFFDRLDALTFTTEVKEISSPYFNIGNASDFTCNTWDSCQFNMLSNSDGGYQYRDFTIADMQTHTVDYIGFKFTLSQPVTITETNQVHTRYCSEFSCSRFEPGTDLCSEWYCSQTSTASVSSDTDTNIYTATIDTLSLHPQVVYTDNDNANCDINGNIIMCPTHGKDMSFIRINYNFRTTKTTSATFVLNKVCTSYNFNSPTQAIENQTQQQQQQHNETMTIITDTNTTTEQNNTISFFENFEFSSDNTGLVGVITAPLRVINSIVNAQFSDLCFTLKSKNVCFPNGNMIWQKSNRDSTWFGSGSISSGIQAFVSLFNLVAGGYILYKMGVSIKRLTEDLINPTNTRIEVMKL